MEEEIGVRVTRSRRRLSVEKSNDTISPLGTPTKKRNQKVALKPHLDNIGENEVVQSPKRTTRRSIAPESDEAVLTPSKRTARVRSNTSLSSLVESPRSLRITRRNSLLAESEPPSKVTPPKPKGTRRISQDQNSISKDENVESESSNQVTPPKPKESRRISQDHNSVSKDENVGSESPSQVTPPKPEETRRISQDHNSGSKDENGNKTKHITRKSLEHNTSLPQAPTLIQNEANDPVSNVNDFTVANLEIKLDEVEEQIFKISPQIDNNIESIDGGMTNVDRFAVALLEINIDDKKTANKVPSTTPPTQLRKSPRLKSKSSCKSPEELSVEFMNKSQEEVFTITNQQNNSISSLDKDVSEKFLISQNISKTRQSFNKNKSFEQNTPAFIEDTSNKTVSPNSLLTAKEPNKISLSNKENESLISGDKSNVSRKSMLDESDSVSSNDSITRRTRTSAKMSPNTSVLATVDSRKLRNSFGKNNSTNTPEVIKLNTSAEQKRGKEKNVSQIIDFHATEEKSNHPNPNNELACETDLKKVAKISCNENDIKSTSSGNKSNDNNNVNDIGKLSHQQSSQIFSTIIMDDEKLDDVPRFSIENKINSCNTIDESYTREEISKFHIEKSINDKPNTEITIDDANISNIVAGNKGEEEKLSVSKKDSNSANIIKENNGKTRDDIAFSDMENDLSENLKEMNESLSSKKSGNKLTPSKSSNDLADSNVIKYKLRNSLSDASQLTPKRTIKSPKLALASSTPKVENIGQIKKLKNVISAPKNSKIIQSESSGDDSDESDLLDNEAVDAGKDYESGDSLFTDEMEEMEQNEIREKGETLNSDEGSADDSDYEKNSFLVSSDEEDEALLSGTGDDLDLSDKELTQSAKSKEKYNKRMSKEQKQASREMYEARHGITNNKKSQRKSLSRKIESDSSESDDSEIILKKSGNQSKMRLDSSCDISKSETEKEISYAQFNNETIIDDSNVKDPLSCTLPFKKRSLSTSSNKSKENNENPSAVFPPNESKEGEIEQVEVDENKSLYINVDKTIDPLSNTACDDDDLSSLSSVDAGVVDNYNSVLSVLNQSNKSSDVKESSSDESDNEKNVKRPLTTEFIPNAPSSNENDNEMITVDTPTINCSTTDNNLKNASDLSSRISDSPELKPMKKNTATENNQDLIESTVEVPVKQGKVNERRKLKETSILDNDISTPDIDMHNLKNVSIASNKNQNVDNKLNRSEGEIKNKAKRKKSFNISSDIEMQDINETKVEEVAKTNSNNEMLNKSKDNVKTESSLEDAHKKISKKTKNKLKNRSLNFNEISNDSLLGNESIIENLNLTIGKKKHKERNSISMTENDINLNAPKCETPKTTRIKSDCVTEDKNKNNDNKKTSMGTAEAELIAEEDTKKSGKKKKKKDRLGNQSLNIDEKDDDKSFSVNASVVDNLNLTVIKKRDKKMLAEKKNSTCDREKSQDEEVVDKSVGIFNASEEIYSKAEAEDDKEINHTENNGDGNIHTKLKKAKKRKTFNKSLNNDSSADASKASIVDNLNLTIPNSKSNINKNKTDSFCGETNKGKDYSVLVMAQMLEKPDSDSEDMNVKLLFSSDEETEGLSGKVEDILSCTAMKEDVLNEEEEPCFPLKKAEAKTNLIANEEGAIGDETQVSGSMSCGKVNKKRKKNRNKIKKTGHSETEATSDTKIEKEEREPSINVILDNHRPEKKSSTKRRRRRKQKEHIADSETAENNEAESKSQTQEAYLKTNSRKGQVVHEPELKAKKRKHKEEPMAGYKKIKLATTAEDKPNEIRRLPQTFLDQLSQASKDTSSAPQVTKLISTSEFKVDRANKRKAKPSEYLEQSVLIGTEPTWTSNTGVMRTVKKPKLLPSIPTVSTSSEGCTTQFKVIPLVGDEQRKDARIGSEYAVRNFRADTLYGKKVRRITSEQLVRKRSNPYLW